MFCDDLRLELVCVCDDLRLGLVCIAMISVLWASVCYKVGMQIDIKRCNRIIENANLKTIDPFRILST